MIFMVETSVPVRAEIWTDCSVPASLSALTHGKGVVCACVTPSMGNLNCEEFAECGVGAPPRQEI